MIKISLKIKNESVNLANYRKIAYSWSQRNLYPKKSREQRNYVGSLGEIGSFYILQQNIKTPKKLIALFYKFNTDVPDEGDISYGNIRLEIKTRSYKDWLIYKNRAQYKQLSKYNNLALKKNIQVLYVWVSYNKFSNKISIEGYNTLNDFTILFMDNNRISAKCNKVRSFKNLINILNQEYNTKPTNTIQCKIKSFTKTHTLSM